MYGVRVKYKEDVYKGMLNIGMRPTIGGTEKTIEVHIIDFERDLYGEESQSTLTLGLEKSKSLSISTPLNYSLNKIKERF